MRRSLAAAVVAIALAVVTPLTAAAQQPSRVARIGVLSAATYVDRIHRREASRSTDREADDARACHQFEDGEGAPSDGPAVCADQGGWGDRVKASATSGTLPAYYARLGLDYLGKERTVMKYDMPGAPPPAVSTPGSRY